MLQAITPMYVMPFTDTSKPYKAFVKSPLLQEITQRERRDLESLMVHKIIGPAGQHVIGIDEELTSLVGK